MTRTRTSVYPDLYEMVIRSGRVRTESSRRTYRETIQQFQSHFPTLTAERVTTAHLTEFCQMGSVSDNTIKRRRSILRSTFELAEYEGVIPKNPASALKFTVQPGNTRRRLGNWLDETTVGQILSACPDDLEGRRARVVLLLGFLMGLRRAAIATMRWDQFTPDLRIWEGTVKGGKLTRKGVPEQLRSVLLAWRDEAPPAAQQVIPTLRNNSFSDRTLVASWDGPANPETIRKIVAKSAERAGVGAIRPHDMRRSLAGILEKKGVALQDIQLALDHSDIGTTSRYLDTNPNRTIAATGGIRFDF